MVFHNLIFFVILIIILSVLITLFPMIYTITLGSSFASIFRPYNSKVYYAWQILQTTILFINIYRWKQINHDTLSNIGPHKSRWLLGNITVDGVEI